MEWDGNNHFLLSMDKTREMVIDFRKKVSVQPLYIQGTHNYLGVNINSRLENQY